MNVLDVRIYAIHYLFIIVIYKIILKHGIIVEMNIIIINKNKFVYNVLIIVQSVIIKTIK